MTGRPQLQSFRAVLKFLSKAVVLGLAVAFLVVWWKPALLGALGSAPATNPGTTPAAPPAKAATNATKADIPL